MGTMHEQKSGALRAFFSEFLEARAERESEKKREAEGLDVQRFLRPFSLCTDPSF